MDMRIFFDREKNRGMNKPFEFRYAWETDAEAEQKYIVEILSLDSIENGLSTRKKLMEETGYTLISRDLWTGETDDEGTRIYANDVVEITYNQELLKRPPILTVATLGLGHTAGFHLRGLDHNGTYSLVYGGSAIRSRLVVGQLWRREAIG